MRSRLPTGVDRVGLAYIRHFSDRAHAVITLRRFSVVLSRRDSDAIFQYLLDQGANEHRFRLGIRSVWASMIALASGNGSRHIPAGTMLINTGHRGLEHSRYASNLRRRGIRNVFMIHDLIPITHAEFCRDGEYERHRRRMRHAATLGAAIIANSQHTLRDFHNAIEEMGLPKPPSIAAPLGAGLTPKAFGNAPIDGPYFVMLGTVEPRKNHAAMLHVWRRLVEHLGANAPKLVIIGQRGWECEHVEDLLERSRQVRSAVVELRRCSDDELHTYLHHARALLFPSFTEGFGLPLVEALSLGVPVIASDLPVFREAAANVPDYIDPLDGLGFIAAITDYTHPDSALRQAQIERIKGFTSPTWHDHLQKVDDFMASLHDA
jgi:glycosyltransferase involved in cell wall biosynthesis